MDFVYFTRPKYNDDALFSYEIINQSNQNIEELIIGEYSENDINSQRIECI